MTGLSSYRLTRQVTSQTNAAKIRTRSSTPRMTAHVTSCLEGRAIWSSPGHIVFQIAAPALTYHYQRLYFLAKVQRGLVEADAGDVIPHSMAEKRLGRG